MPTENELKYIVSLECESKIKKLAKRQLLIEQGYIMASKGVSLRLRKSHGKGVMRHYMTFKCSANGRVVEIEKRIDERDFDDLWPQCMNKLIKIRYLVFDQKKHLWEVDFFKNYNNENYFAMAEFEMPEGQMKPEVIPTFIKQHLIYEVLLTDCRFSSKLLADIRYAMNLYKTIGEQNGKISL